MSFVQVLESTGIATLRGRLDRIPPARVERALAVSEVGFDDFLALVSPAARRYLEPMAQKAHALTVQRFGRVILMYAPLYLTNVCTNSCLYCGFNVHRRVPRVTLSLDEILQEAAFLKNRGFAHLLLVSGEAPQVLPVARLEEILRALCADFPSLSLEVYPLSQPAYAQMAQAGADGLTLYQETYHRPTYAEMHPGGRKRNFEWRLEAVERAAAAGFRRLGIGALLGLYDWRWEAIALAKHADYLMKRFWRTQVTISFPRLRNTPESFQIPQPVSDADLVQMMLALRLFLPDAGIVLSTREPAALRDRLIPLGVTQMSAGSRTEPGGYLHPLNAGAQFDVDDKRNPDVVADAVRLAGYEPVWKDWDRLMHERADDENYRQRDAQGCA